MGGKHALIIPVPAQAHYAGIFRLTVELAKRGVSVTFLGFPEELERLKRFDEVHELDFNLLPYPNSEAYPSKDIVSFLPYARDSFQPIFEKLLEDQKAGRAGPTCIIADRTLRWPIDIAKELQIPYYQFFSCGAIKVRVLQAMCDMFADGILTKTDEAGGNLALLKEFEGAKEMPGVPSLRWREMPSLGEVGADFFTDVGRIIGDADGVIVNSFADLEAPAIDAIRQRWMEDSREKQNELFLVGPLSNVATSKNRLFVSDLNHTRGGDYLQWLDEQPPRSVIYFSLGSLVALDSHQMQELAGAIEASEQRFLWVVNRGEEALPPDFAARTRERGLVVNGWVPQLQILAHPATGGFVTHCGWNSIIESVSLGVPMAAWPQLRIDQFLNCRLLVDVLKIAVEVNPDWIGEETIPPEMVSWRKVIPDEIVKAMRLLLSEEGNALRSRAEVLKEKARTAVADGGARIKAINHLVECIPC